LTTSHPPLGCRAFIAYTNLRYAFWVTLHKSTGSRLTNNYHAHTVPGVWYYQYNNDIPVSA